MCSLPRREIQVIVSCYRLWKFYLVISYKSTMVSRYNIWGAKAMFSPWLSEHETFFFLPLVFCLEQSSTQSPVSMGGHNSTSTTWHRSTNSNNTLQHHCEEVDRDTANKNTTWEESVEKDESSLSLKHTYTHALTHIHSPRTCERVWWREIRRSSSN